MKAPLALIKAPSRLTKRLSTPQRWRENIPALDMGESDLHAFSFNGLREKVIPERPVILCRNGEPLFREGDLIQIFAAPGVGKSWFARTLALLMATGGEMSAMGFTGPKRPICVLYIDGEMASRDIQDRDNVLVKALSIHGEPLLYTIAADWQEEPLPLLDTKEGRAAIEPAVDWADVVIFDNRTCLFNAAGERDPIVWADTQRLILDLRRRCKTVILVHHTSVRDETRGSGIGNPERVLNWTVGLSRPEGYDQTQGARFTLKFGKKRGAYGVVVEDATLALTDDGWTVEASGSQLTTLDQRIIDAVKGGAYKSKTEVYNALKKIGGAGKSKTFYAAFDKLEEQGILERVERGFRGKYRWVVVEGREVGSGSSETVEIDENTE